MNPTPNGNLGLNTYSTSPSAGNTVIINNGVATSPSPGLMAPRPPSSSQPEQIIVPISRQPDHQASSSASSSRPPPSTPQANTPGASASTSTPSDKPDQRVLDRQRLRDLVKEVDPLEQMDEDVEEVLLQVADDFIENVVASSCQLAKHRKSNTLEAKDVQLYLERCWNMQIPGFGGEEQTRPYKKSAATEAHKQRMALIRKTLKKY